MSERLNDLQRQRALAQEQVAWFDREIAREQGELPATAPASPANPPPAGAVNPTPQSATELDRKAEEILKRFKHVEHPVRDDVRRGCFMYFFTAFALLAFALFAFYMLHRQPE